MRSLPTATQAASFQSLVEAAERDDPLNQGWRILPDEGTHSGLSTAQVWQYRRCDPASSAQHTPSMTQPRLVLTSRMLHLPLCR